MYVPLSCPRCPADHRAPSPSARACAGAWAALVAGEAAVALVAGWRERRARRRFVQAQLSRPFAEFFAITARAG